MQLAVDLSAELERVEALAQVSERSELSTKCGVVRFRGRQTIQGCLRKVILAVQLRADPHALDQLGPRLKEIQPQAELVPVQLIHGFDRLRGVTTVPARQLADVGPILLLDVGIIVFLERTAVGELHLLAGAPGAHMPVDELRAVVGADAVQSERQRRLNLFQGVQAVCTSVKFSE